jgi:CelD/BcsL family acetyltransferase involved in cellulose biosynthesis
MATALRWKQKTGRDSSAGALELLRAGTPDDLDLLEEPWRAMDVLGGCPSSQYGWTRACLRALCEGATMQIVGVERGEELLAVAPLVRKRLHCVHRQFLAGASQLHEPMDLVWTNQDALRRLASAIVRSGSPLVLERVPADSKALVALVGACRGRSLVTVRPQAPYPYIELDESWVEPEQHLSPSDRSDLSHARRQAEQLGQVMTEIHTPGLHELPGLLDTAFAVEARGCQGAGANSPSKDPHRAVFYRQYAQAACVDGALRICFLRIGDRVAAMQLAVESGGGLWLLKAGHDERFGACSPMHLLLRETIRYGAEAALSTLAFWGGRESCTQIWPTALRQCVSLRTYPFGVRGLAALVADAAVAGWLKWASRPRPCQAGTST